MRRALAMAALMAFGLAGAAEAQAQHTDVGLPSLVVKIAADSLHDVAVAVYHPYRGVIYYNPGHMRAAGAELAAFFWQHEFGHLYYHHVRGYALLGNDQLDTQLQEAELEADCYATRQLADTHREAVEEAIQFFTRMGRFRHDSAHPTGSQRAAKILSCIP